MHLPVHIAHPHATRERENRALGPWRNQFKWLSVDVIDFHFTRLSRGRRSSTRCAVSIPTPPPPSSRSLSCIRVSPFLTPFLSFSIRFASSASRSISSSLSYTFVFLFLAPAAHACDAYVHNIERINTHYNVSAGASRQESGFAGHNRFLTPRSAMISAGRMEVKY